MVGRTVLRTMAIATSLVVAACATTGNGAVGDKAGTRRRPARSPS